jgi:hypothetical protein
VSALDAFMTTWARARATFGAGAPAEGAQFDQSSRLHQLQSDVASAAPGALWTGSASDAYAEANSKQARTLGSVGDLDKRLGAEVDRSAAVVTAGRRELEAVKQWVSDAAATVPNTPAGQRMLWPVISKGSSEIQDILTRSNGELSSIADRIRGIGSEYQALGDEEGNGGTKLDKDENVPQTALDLKDIVQLAPVDASGHKVPGPAGYKELVPGSGTWVPDPSSSFYRPTPVEAPLDLDDIVQLAPVDSSGHKVLGPAGYIELVPGSGTWVPDPNGPRWPTSPPTAPLDLTKIVVADPKALGQPWQMELVPGSGVWVPDPHYGGPH